PVWPVGRSAQRPFLATIQANGFWLPNSSELKRMAPSCKNASNSALYFFISPSLTHRKQCASAFNASGGVVDKSRAGLFPVSEAAR
ncbi:MAG: hypothetical protein MOB07_28235, partial [Acidobacteria bacterium]|nr:hypothetical protein [Acidobacteriota bacterium]